VPLSFPRDQKDAIRKKKKKEKGAGNRRIASGFGPGSLARPMFCSSFCWPEEKKATTPVPMVKSLL